MRFLLLCGEIFDDVTTRLNSRQLFLYGKIQTRRLRVQSHESFLNCHYFCIVCRLVQPKNKFKNKKPVVFERRVFLSAMLSSYRCFYVEIDGVEATQANSTLFQAPESHILAKDRGRNENIRHSRSKPQSDHKCLWLFLTSCS